MAKRKRVADEQPNADELVVDTSVSCAEAERQALKGGTDNMKAGWKDRLTEIAKELKGKIPTLRKIPDFKDVSLGDKIRLAKETAKQIQEDVVGAVNFLVPFRQENAKYEDDKFALDLLDREAGKTVADMEEYLERIFELEDNLFLRVAAAAYIKAVMSQSFNTFREVWGALQDLQKRKILELVKSDSYEKNQIRIGYQRYVVSERFGFEKENIAEIAKSVNKFSLCFEKLVKEHREEQKEEVEKEADITLEEALAGKNGKCFFEVPTESYKDNEGKERWHNGGTLFVEFTDKEVLPIVGIGAIESIVRSMVSKKIKLFRQTLYPNWSSPPGSGNAFSRVQAGVMRNLGLDTESAEDYVNKMKIFWHLVRRGLKFLEDQEEMKKLKEEYHSEDEITSEAFYGLDGESKEGITCLEFNGAFKKKENRVFYHVFFLANISREGERKVVEIKKVPDHASGLLGEFVGKKYPADNNFSDCPQQLGQVLRGIRGQVEHHHAIAK